MLQGRKAIVLALLIDSLGTGLYQPFSLLYFQQVARLDLPAIGLVLTLATLLTVPLNPITGSLVDRFGSRRLVVISQLIQAVGFLGYLFVSTIPMLFVTSFLTAAGSRVFYASASTLIAEIAVHDERDRWFGFVGAIRNVGLMGGGLLAGIIVAFGGSNGYHVLILANVLSFLLMAVVLLWQRSAYQSSGQTEDSSTIQAEEVWDEQEKQALYGQLEAKSGYRVILTNRPFLVLVVCNIVFALCPSLMSLGLPVYTTEALRSSTATVGALFAFSSLLVICAQTVTVRLLEPFRRTRSLLFACLLTPYLFGAVAVYTFANIIAGTLSAVMVAASSPAHLLGRFMALHELSWGIAGAIAPTMFAWLYATGPSRAWIALMVPILLVSPLLLWLETHLSACAIFVRQPVGSRKQSTRQTKRTHN